MVCAHQCEDRVNLSNSLYIVRLYPCVSEYPLDEFIEVRTFDWTKGNKGFAFKILDCWVSTYGKAMTPRNSKHHQFMCNTCKGQIPRFGRPPQYADINLMTLQCLNLVT